MTKPLVALILLGLACDDPAVTAKVAEVMEHGAVKAYAHCERYLTPLTSGGYENFYDASLFQDGSSFSKFLIRTYSNPATAGSMMAGGGYAYIPRGVIGSETAYSDNRFQGGRQWITAEAVDGVVQYRAYDIDLYTPHTYASNYDCGTDCNMDMATYCTGFNLSAFGVVE